MRWRAVAGFPNYQVSDTGLVRAVRRTRFKRAGERISTRIVCARRYRMVTLVQHGKRCDRMVHHLVCTAFHGRRPRGKQVAHWDGNGLNNRARNLRWTTAKGNAEDRARHGRTQCGERHYAAKLTAAQVREIRARDKRSKASGTSRYGFLVALARQYGVTKYAIEDIISGRKWRTTP